MTYQAKELSWDGRTLKYGEVVIPARTGEQDHAPGEVAEVRLITPVDQIEQNDAAVIKVPAGAHTPIQEFTGSRRFAETTSDGMIWVGRAPTGETMTICTSPNMVCPLVGKGSSIEYGEGWVGSWINVGNGMASLLELCMPKFESDGTIIEHDVDDPTIGEWYWKMWHAVKGDRV